MLVQIFRLGYCKIHQNLILGDINIRNLKRALGLEVVWALPPIGQYVLNLQNDLEYVIHESTRQRSIAQPGQKIKS